MIHNRQIIKGLAISRKEVYSASIGNFICFEFYSRVGSMLKSKLFSHSPQLKRLRTPDVVPLQR